jgi:small subunit ribosomal protein S16
MVKIRLMRMGAIKRPFFRVVVADSRSPRDGRFIENIGKYHPMNDPSLIEIDQDRALYWLSQGAQPTAQVTNLLRIVGVLDRFQESKGGTKKKAAPATPAAATPAPPAPASDSTAEPSS